MKYKLIEPMLSVEAGTIGVYNGFNGYDFFNSEGEGFTVSENLVKNSDSFISSVLTTYDGEDVFEGDIVWYISQDKNLHFKTISFSNYTENFKFFLTRKAAEEYIKVIESFELGEIVKDVNGVGRIIEMSHPPSIYCTVKYANRTTSKQTLASINKASKDDVIEYYEQLGWVENALFVYKRGIYILEKLEIINNACIVIDKGHNILTIVRVEECDLLNDL